MKHPANGGLFIIGIRSSRNPLLKLTPQSVDRLYKLMYHMVVGNTTNTKKRENKTMNNENITARIEAYVGLVNDLIVIEEASIGSDRFTELHKTAIVRTGKKYAKVVTAELNRNSPLTGSMTRLGKPFTAESVHTFIDMTNGDILKAASYKAPAKNGVRGNIFADDLGRSCINGYGANYLNDVPHPFVDGVSWKPVSQS